MIILYGISNCDTIRKTGRWLTDAGLRWTLHDYRKQGLDAALLAMLLDQFGDSVLLNRRGTTWRQLDAEQQQKADTRQGLIELLLEHPAMIKRPIVQTADQQWLMGYEPIVQYFSNAGHDI